VRDELLQAVTSGDAERVRELLASAPDLAAARDDDGISAVRLARYRDRHGLVALLLAAGPELDVFDAAAVGRTERVRELVEADPALARARAGDGFTALHLAEFFGHDQAARALVEAGADVDALADNDLRVMPLGSAAAAGHAEVAELLLAHGARADEAYIGGVTPLHGAAQNGDLRLVDLLLANGADPGRAADDGRTAAAAARDAPRSGSTA
jgi:ankyrin repeat protein